MNRFWCLGVAVAFVALSLVFVACGKSKPNDDRGIQIRTGTYNLNIHAGNPAYGNQNGVNSAMFSDPATIVVSKNNEFSGTIATHFTFTAVTGAHWVKYRFMFVEDTQFKIQVSDVTTPQWTDIAPVENNGYRFTIIGTYYAPDNTISIMITKTQIDNNASATSFAVFSRN